MKSSEWLKVWGGDGGDDVKRSSKSSEWLKARGGHISEVIATQEASDKRGMNCLMFRFSWCFDLTQRLICRVCVRVFHFSPC